MKYIKKYKFTILIIVIFILLVVIGTKVVDLLFPNIGKPVYGSRLGGIETVTISTKRINELEKNIKEYSEVTDFSYELKGKLINVIITVTDETNTDKAKEIANKVLESFEEKEIDYYDFQVFFKKTNKDLNDFPIIGYKHVKSIDFIWTKNRDIVNESAKEEETE